MRALTRILRRQPDDENAREIDPLAPPSGDVWESVSHFAAEIQQSDFMVEMTRHLEGPGGPGLMGAPDCATLYGLTRWRRPKVIVESGGNLGMSTLL